MQPTRRELRGWQQGRLRVNHAVIMVDSTVEDRVGDEDEVEGVATVGVEVVRGAGATARTEAEVEAGSLL